MLDHLISEKTSHGAEKAENVSAGVATAVHHAARASRAAEQPLQTRKETRLRVLAGSGEETLPFSTYLSAPVTRKCARAQSRSKSCGMVRIANCCALNTSHSTFFAPTVRRRAGGGDPINQSVLPELSIFICPLQHLTPTPKSAASETD